MITVVIACQKSLIRFLNIPVLTGFVPVTQSGKGGGHRGMMGFILRLKVISVRLISEVKERGGGDRRGGEEGAHTYTSTLLARRLPACIIFTLRLIHFLPGCHSQRDYPSVNFVCHLPAVTHSVITVGVLLACGCEGHNDIVRVQI